MKTIPLEDFKVGMIVNLMTYRNPTIEIIKDILGKSILKILGKRYGDGIILAQRYLAKPKIPKPGYYSTHEEQVIKVTSTEVWTFSQEEKAKIVKRSKAEIIAGMIGDKPRYVVWELSWRDYIDQRFINGMMGRYDKLLGTGKGFWGKLKSGIYDVFQVPGYLLNWTYYRLGGRKHLNWFNLPGSFEVCSSAVVSGTRCGLIAMNWWREFIWEGITSNADIAPGHNWWEAEKEDPRLWRVLPQ